MSDLSPVITIDGPSGSGKGTMAKRLASALGWHLLDSGVLYRILAMAAKQHAVDLHNAEALQVLAEHLDVVFDVTPGNEPACVILESQDITDVIRTEEWGGAASKIAEIPEVRAALLSRQRAFRNWPGLVTDGRDMGTVIFPDAQLKIFLVASREERAKRRYNQLREKGINVTLDAVLDEVVERDERDRVRTASPLKPATDAMLVDTTGLTVENVFLHILKEVEKRFAGELLTA